MSKAEFKSEGLDALRLYLLAQPRGVSVRQSDLARHFAVNRSTIGRWIESLEATEVPVRFDEQKRVSIDRGQYITHLRLSRHESVVLMLALRLYQQRQNTGDRNVVAMLQKLGVALHQGVAPTAGEHVLAIAQQQRLQLGEQPTEQQRVLEVLGDAWLDTLKVQMRYRPLRARSAFDDTFHPYLLEPSAISRTTYVIGYSELSAAIRVRKLERIERTPMLLGETFSVTPSFEPFKLLGGAWSIWFDADAVPTTVQLRFYGEKAIRRVLEERWHPSERTERDAEGRLVWTAEVDEPLEMLPWIRGWGPACEVLAPMPLRERVIAELRRQSALYQIDTSPASAVELWAHTPAPGSDVWHPLLEHLRDVAELARSFATPFGAGELAYQLGLWHDVGKADPAFQAYLKRCFNDPSQKGSGPDHKAAGTLLAKRHFQHLAQLIHGHHGGLKTVTDLDTWLAERQQQRAPAGQQTVAEAAIATIERLLPAIIPAKKLPFPPFLRDKLAAEFFLRMLFSTLVDADYLDTEQHRSPHHAVKREEPIALATLLERFEAIQQSLTGQREDALGRARHAFYTACCKAAEQPPGLFRLAVPTGGGKTRSAMAFALRHAIHYGMRRVIVAVPFISITEQTAQVYRSIFEGETDAGRVVLEHHSGAEGRRNEAEQYHAAELWARLSAENWDASVVVTTTVQLFESLFAAHTGRCRKLHRLAGSVIVLDEVQALPTALLTPILSALHELTANYGATVVLATATQPAFEQLPEYRSMQAFDIVPDAKRWFAALRRVTYDWSKVKQPVAWDEVAAAMRSEPAALAVVNTKGDALALLDALGDENALHLSTLLCGAHRRAVIAEVHRRLRAGEPCRLVSTQVIEAGVDLDFPLVLRALGPLDRIIQAAGRCNREGRPELGRVVVFTPAEGRLPPGPYKTATALTSKLLNEGGLDPDDPALVQRFFQELFTSVSRDSYDIQPQRVAWNYPEVARRFRMIAEETEDVIVAYGSLAERDEVQELIAAIRRKEPGARRTLRRLQPLLVALRSKDAERYRRSGLIEPLLPDGDLPIGIWHGQYHPVRGIVADDDRSTWIV